MTMPTAYSFIEHLLACGLSWWRVTQDLVVLSSLVRPGNTPFPDQFDPVALPHPTSPYHGEKTSPCEA